jgi:ceramide glucosyltransferase
MSHFIFKAIEIVAVFGMISSSAYYLLCLWGARNFLLEPKAADRACPEPAEGSVRPTQSLPPVSILKPLKGIDPEIYESFRSHCLQDYPEYEIVFGVSDPNDPAIASVEKLQREFPSARIRLVVCPKILGPNVKVSNLAQMLPLVRYEHLIVNDSDIRVEGDYLRRVGAPLADEKVGMVTCLYRGVAASTFGSRLEALGISTDFFAGVFAARQLEGGIRFGLGSTLAFRRADLARAGGFESLLDYLADDYELGKRIADLGLGVVLSDSVVETHLPAYDLPGFVSHQLRWARGVRHSRARGYLGLLFTFGLWWSLLALVLSQGAAWVWALFGVTLFLRLAVALVVGRVVLGDGELLENLWMLPLRDFIAVGVWIASFAGDTVSWRGDRFTLKDGRLVRNSHLSG